MYTADYFINKFKAIPGERWIVGMFELHGQRCALGHCGMTQNTQSVDLIPEAHALANLFAKYQLAIVQVNDNEQNGYRYGSPRENVLHALGFIKAKEDEEAASKAVNLPVTRALIKYVAVDAEIREEAQELILEESN